MWKLNQCLAGNVPQIISKMFNIWLILRIWDRFYHKVSINSVNPNWFRNQLTFFLFINMQLIVDFTKIKIRKVSTETQVSQLWAYSLYRLVISVPDALDVHSIWPRWDTKTLKCCWTSRMPNLFVLACMFRHFVHVRLQNLHAHAQNSVHEWRIPLMWLQLSVCVLPVYS